MELIERDGLLTTLQSHYDRVATGEGHCLFISGEAGLGKTSLVKTFCRRLKDECTIYRGTCDALFTPRPLAPLYDILWQVSPDLDTTGNTREEQSGLFVHFFRELNARKGVSVIVFEDIHWADEATLDFIKFFARRITELRCLFILTYRDDEVSSRHSLRNVLGDISPDLFSRLQLSPLSQEAVTRLADAKGFDADNVYRISGGNPFYVNEILANYSPGVPDNIKDAILAVYDRQEEGTKNAWQITSVVPDGLEIPRFTRIRASWDKAMDHCFAMNVLVVKDEKVVFKHELYRMTIEESLSLSQRMMLNKTILDLLLDSFEETGEIARIVHYAKNAAEHKLVAKYAPMAAKQAAIVGSHMEAAKLYLTAINDSHETDANVLVGLYEAYAYEAFLCNQISEALHYQDMALAIRQQQGNPEQIAISLRFLSVLCRFKGDRDASERFAQQAVDAITARPVSKAKALVFCHMSTLKMFSEEPDACAEWGNAAIEMAKEIGDENIHCQALLNVGASCWRTQATNQKAKELLFEGLNMARRHSHHEHAARGYSNIISNYITFREYKLAKQFLVEGISYCEEHGLHSSKNYKLYLQSRLLMETGHWKEAAAIADNLLNSTRQPVIIRIGALVVAAILKTRTGDPGAEADLIELKSLVFPTREHHQIIPAVIAMLEFEWISGKQILDADELEEAIKLVRRTDNILLNSDFSFWLLKVRVEDAGIGPLAEPYQLIKEKKTVRAAQWWASIGCPYEKAFAQYEGNDKEKIEGLSGLQQLGAAAVAEKIKMEMRADGIKKIPRGQRQSTKTNPAQLTNRELDVLNLLQRGIQNKEIAGTLFISPKTADHHISSILFKLDVNSRVKAVEVATRLGILK